MAERGLNSQVKHKGSLPSVILGWAMTIFIILAVLSMVIVIIINELETPVGLYNYHCYGFFPTCDAYVCVDVDPSVASTGSYSALSSLATWKPCHLNSTVKLQTQGCVFDEELYTLTKHEMGYDVCKSEFHGGVYVFEDTFEHWSDNDDFTSNSMKSAVWADMINAATTGNCGTGEVMGGKKALTFAGEFERYAETQDVDVVFGGWLEAELFLAPVGYDTLYEKYYCDVFYLCNVYSCKTAYTGAVEAQYSIDGGNTWFRLHRYEAWKYRQSNFFHIKLEVPNEGKTNATRFRFIQAVFDAAGDSWALDNVKVYHYFEQGWEEDEEYKKGKKETAAPIQKAQCCYDTEWCETRISESDVEEECKNVPYFTETIYQLRGTELFISLAVFANILKFLYVSGQHWIMHGRVPFHEELNELRSIEWLLNLIPEKYRPEPSIEDVYNDIHKSARVQRGIRDAFDDAPVQETEEERKARVKEEKKRKKQMAKQAKLAAKGVLPVTVEEESKQEAKHADRVYDIENISDSIVDTTIKDTSLLGVTNVSTVESVDDLKRRDLSLRTPIDLNDSRSLRRCIGFALMLTYVICFLYKSSTQADYSLTQKISAYGRFSGEIVISSGGILFLAMFCDAKELYHVIRHVIPFFDAWVQPVTLDTTFDINALFVGHHTISLSSITEAHAFSIWFMRFSVLGYMLGAFPWCMFSMILRDQYLPFDVMRIVTPSLGAIIILRAITGPGVFIKLLFTLQFMLDFNLKTREEIGAAFSAQKTRYAAVHGALIFATLGVFIISAVAVEWLLFVFGIFLLVGFIFGSITGCIHSLPIRPWMMITSVDEGIWFRVKKKQRCPCVYWGKYCTDMHDAIEIFVIFPRDQVMLLERLKGATAG